MWYLFFLFLTIVAFGGTGFVLLNVMDVYNQAKLGRSPDNKYNPIFVFSDWKNQKLRKQVVDNFIVKTNQVLTTDSYAQIKFEDLEIVPKSLKWVGSFLPFIFQKKLDSVSFFLENSVKAEKARYSQPRIEWIKTYYMLLSDSIELFSYTQQKDENKYVLESNAQEWSDLVLKTKAFFNSTEVHTRQGVLTIKERRRLGGGTK